jgi:hypothetical protein
METKICTKCGVEKNISEFSNSQYTKDGKRCTCKLCDKLFRYVNYEKSKQASIRYRIRKRQKSLGIYHEEIKETHRMKYKDILHHRTRGRKKRNNESRKMYEKRYRNEHCEQIKTKQAKFCENLNDYYISNVLRIPIRYLKQYPELIETKRLQLKIYRELNKLS